ncbi:MAG: SIS domain-containing protein [bacterium]|nr:SIS domain-containing protein [bacterium]
MIYDAIKNFQEQFRYEPEIENGDSWKRKKTYVVIGMGGSHLAADILKCWKPELSLFVHHDYDLPPFPDGFWKDAALIASSYSGNTEETLSAFEEAGTKNIARSAVSIGGMLLASAKEANTPYVRLPDAGIQPRLATGFMAKAILALMGEKGALREMSDLAGFFSPESFEEEGRALAKRIKGFVPVVYASEQNAALAENWKIKFNETGKIPSFWNTFSELNHNEMTGFDVKDATRSLSDQFMFLFLKDESDSPKIQKRMAITAELYRARGFMVEEVVLSGKTALEKIFGAFILGDWTAYYTAKGYGVEPEEVPMVEEFKKMIA